MKYLRNPNPYNFVRDHSNLKGIPFHCTAGIILKGEWGEGSGEGMWWLDLELADLMMPSIRIVVFNDKSPLEDMSAVM